MADEVPASRHGAKPSETRLLNFDLLPSRGVEVPANQLDGPLTVDHSPESRVTDLASLGGYRPRGLAGDGH